MSRKAKLPIALPKGVELKSDKDTVTVKGPKGSLSQAIRKEISVEVKENNVVVTLHPQYDQMNNFLGLFWVLIDNMVKGVTLGFDKKLEMVGVGFRAAVQGTKLDLQVGRSHPTQLEIPQGIKVAVEKNTLITISGIDKQQVGQFAAEVRAIYRPEPYKGKGIRYADEFVRKKAGKAAKAAK